jgi:hypothetical protein
MACLHRQLAIVRLRIQGVFDGFFILPDIFFHELGAQLRKTDDAAGVDNVGGSSVAIVAIQLRPEAVGHRQSDPQFPGLSTGLFRLAVKRNRKRE